MPEAWLTNLMLDFISAGYLQAGLAACEPWCLAQKSMLACPPGYPWETWFARWEVRGPKSLTRLKSMSTHLGCRNSNCPPTGLVGLLVLYRFDLSRLQGWKMADWKTWNVDISRVVVFCWVTVTIMWIVFRARGGEEHTTRSRNAVRIWVSQWYMPASAANIPSVCSWSFYGPCRSPMYRSGSNVHPRPARPFPICRHDSSSWNHYCNYKP